MMDDLFWITSRLPRTELSTLGVEIGRTVPLSAGGLACHRECKLPEEAIDPLFDLWNEGKLMFGYEDDPEDQNHSKDYLRIIESRAGQPNKLTSGVVNRSGPPLEISPPAKRIAAIRRQHA